MQFESESENDVADNQIEERNDASKKRKESSLFDIEFIENIGEADNSTQGDQESENENKDDNQNTFGLQNQRNARGPRKYKHWNILYENILKLRFEKSLSDKDPETQLRILRPITKEE